MSKKEIKPNIKKCEKNNLYKMGENQPVRIFEYNHRRIKFEELEPQLPLYEMLESEKILLFFDPTRDKLWVWKGSNITNEMKLLARTLLEDILVRLGIRSNSDTFFRSLTHFTLSHKARSNPKLVGAMRASISRDWESRVTSINEGEENLDFEVFSGLIKDKIPTEFKANEFLTLRLVNNKTFIYVKGWVFLQCKRLFLQIPPQNINVYDRIDSIDEATEIYEKFLLDNKIVQGEQATPLTEHSYNISPEQEFWGHCSNIQVWVEQNYDTRILHSNLAFPLLKTLTDAGDRLVIIKLKEEIAFRLESGYLPVILYLIEQKYLSYLPPDYLSDFFEKQSKEDINQIFINSDPSLLEKMIEEDYLQYLSDDNYIYVLENFCRIPAEEKIALRQLQAQFKVRPRFYGINTPKKLNPLAISIVNGRIKKLILNIKLNEIPLPVYSLKYLEKLHMLNFSSESLSENVSRLNNLKELVIHSDKLKSLPKSIKRLKSLESLTLETKFLNFPTKILKLMNLKELNLHKIRIDKIPPAISKLIFLEVLSLCSNHLTSLPSSIGDLHKLRRLRIKFNNLTELPESISNLYRLEDLNLSYNNLTLLPESIGKLGLKILNISHNKITKLPSSIKNLNSLKNLYLIGNPFKEIPLGFQLIHPYLNQLERDKFWKLFPSECMKLHEIEKIIKFEKFEYLPKLVEYMTGYKGLIASLNSEYRGYLLFSLKGNSVYYVRIRSCDLDNINLEKILRILLQFKSLEILELEHNHFTILPEFIGELTSLRKLILSDNYLDTLPLTIGDLSDLESLAIDHNPLTSLPSSLNKLQNLKELEIHWTTLSELPNSLKEFKINNNLKLKLKKGKKGIFVSAVLKRLEVRRPGLDSVLKLNKSYKVEKELKRIEKEEDEDTILKPSDFFRL